MEASTSRPNSLPAMSSDSPPILPASASSVPVWNLPDPQQLQTTNKIGSSVLRRGGLVLHLRATTWAADSHGLFDYESRSVHLKILKCNCFRDSYHIIRVGTDVQLLAEDQAKALYASEPRSKLLAQLSWSNGTYNLVPGIAVSNNRAPNSPSNQNERLWLVVRTLKERGVAVTEGDVIKLGRYRIRVKEVVLSPQDAKTMGSRRFLCHTDDDDDDCETVAPDPIDTPIIGTLDNSSHQHHQQDLELPISEGRVQNISNNNHDTNNEYNDGSAAMNLTSATETQSVIGTGGHPPLSCSDDVTSRRSSPRASPDLSTPSSLSNLHQQQHHNASSSSSSEEPVTNATTPASAVMTTSGCNGTLSSTTKNLFRAKSSMGSRICRICLCEADEDDIDDETNPLVAPCECKGSMKWVHLMCLRTWMAGRLNIRNDGSMVCFFWRSLECELCKVLYPPVVKIVDPNCISSSDDENNGQHHNGNNIDQDQPDATARYRRMSDSKAYYGKTPSLSSHHRPLKKSKSAQGYRTVELFEIPRPEVPYMILEPRGQQSRGLHVVSLANNKTARLGRGHESDIRLADISVSRLHAILRFQSPPAKRSGSAMILGGSGGIASVNPSPHGCFVIEDNRSKFGTLVEVRKPFRLDPQSAVQIAFQVGRTVLTFTLKRRWRFMFPACLRNSHTDVSVLAQQAPTQPTTVAGQPSAFAARAAELPSNNSISHPPVAFGGALERDDPSSDEDEQEENHQQNNYNTASVAPRLSSAASSQDAPSNGQREIPERSERGSQLVEERVENHDHSIEIADDIHHTIGSGSPTS